MQRRTRSKQTRQKKKAALQNRPDSDDVSDNQPLAVRVSRRRQQQRQMLPSESELEIESDQVESDKEQPAARSGQRRRRHERISLSESEQPVSKSPSPQKYLKRRPGRRPSKLVQGGGELSSDDYSAGGNLTHLCVCEHLPR